MRYLVTGASSGIGYEVALYLTLKGNEVLTTSRREVSLPGKHKHFVADFRNADEVLFLAEWVKANFGALDGLINNAGALQLKQFSDIDFEDLYDMFNVNFFAHWLLTKELIPILYRHVINIASIS